MKTRKNTYRRFIAIILTGIFVASCGSETPTGPAFQVQLLMPATLTRSEARYQRFLARATHLKITVTSPSGGEIEKVFPQQDWTQMTLPMVSASDEEKVKIIAEIWDRTSEGKLRAYPVMRGQASVEGKDLSEEPAPTIPVPMTLRISVSEYD